MSPVIVLMTPGTVRISSASSVPGTAVTISAGRGAVPFPAEHISLDTALGQTSIDLDGCE